MEQTFLDPSGTPVDAQSFTIPRARDLADALGSGVLDFVRLVECKRCDAGSADGEAEIIVLDLDVQRPQLTVNDIRRVERVAVVLEADDASYPDVLALRSDFPLVPHLNLRKDEFPRSLCLYDQSWDEVRTRWTASAFIERIRTWLADTATGTLHRDDQPLEPLLFGTPYRSFSIRVARTSFACVRIESGQPLLTAWKCSITGPSFITNGFPGIWK